MTVVVAALIQSEDRILICQRKDSGPHALKWEFPGGKMEPDETPHAALYRELREELGIVVTSATEITRYPYAYPGKAPIELIFFAVRNFGGTLENKIFQHMAWHTPAELTGFDFLEGDLPLIQRLGEFQIHQIH